MFATLQNRPLALHTPLGVDALLLTHFRGSTALAQLFQFELDLRAASPGIAAFDKVLGQPACVRVQQVDGSHAFFHGLISLLERVGQDTTHVHYRALLVPRLWLLTKKIQSRIFQQQAVPDILQTIFEPLRPDLEFKLQNRDDYLPRNYCVQYRESDFAFASRLMEEEGLYYYFEHSDKGHKLIVTDSHNLLPAPAELATLKYAESAGENPEFVRLTSWRKRQEVGSGSFTLWDQCFELANAPGQGFQTLEAKKNIADAVKAGIVDHPLNLSVSDALEVYDGQAGYAKCFDGIDAAGKEQADSLTRIFDSASHRAQRRAEAEAAACFRTGGNSNCALLAPGQKFQLAGQLDIAGQYYLTRVEHEARAGHDRSGGELPFEYR
ncbi:MAG: type VI secretion system Vgr family protein, partial [Gemmataceae bacterium]